MYTLFKVNINIVFCILALFLSACGGADSSDTGTAQQGLSDQVVQSFVPGERVQLDAIASSYTGVSYPLKIYLPQNRVANKTYPVIYALDAEWRFDTIADSLDDNKMEVIVVGVENYADDNYKHREDYSQWPLARDYFDFINKELAPSIEARYPVNQSDRTIMGHSNTGLIVGLVLLMDDPQQPFFHRHVSFDGSFWAHPETTSQLIDDRRAQSQALKSRTILVGANGSIGNVLYVRQFDALLERANFAQLDLTYLEYKQDHIPVVAHSMDEVLTALYQN
ncbi:alpha/beta hydrolase [Pseudoalteromonas rubra]|uniref:alpha/beta hydrolase n=1 Tax=Pseudoalteromonas rubra TaxID=43658 RepID=UPI002DB73B38|nr:alpha/beta hydrolase-fold protein [Pseudoalteromonas rubra]MEC4090546.1 alpha/beta hydrolase-fold protein [Pseudoalteromonas rubra]